MVYKEVFDIIKASLWNENTIHDVDANNEILLTMKNHRIEALPAYLLSEMSMSEKVKAEWQKSIYKQITYYYNYTHIQSSLPISVPYVILKGCSAAQYYPHPELRSMGDIDIMTRREDYQKACDELIQNGYKETTSSIEIEYGRHRSFIKNSIFVEMHAFFALFNDKEKTEFLDNLIIRNISSGVYLPDMINGLVILEHINQHLEKGIGLRQIIDWMMFADKCLQGDKWSEFILLAQKIGLEKLTIAITKMCELYLGLNTKGKKLNIEKKIPEKLMKYIMECGNFGQQAPYKNDTTFNVFMIARTPKAAYRLLQERGHVNWKVVREHKNLKCFSWIYQAGRYLCRGLKQKSVVHKTINNYKMAQDHNKLFNKLGVKRGYKGVVVLKNGEYKKTDKSM